jgi:hypothetical protein
MGEPEIDIAIKAFDENQRNTPIADAYHYNLAVGLLAMARAVKELQKQVESSKREVSDLRHDVRKL